MKKRLVRGLRILWLCNQIIPEFKEAYEVRHMVLEGWISGMLGRISKYDDIEVFCCFPIRDESRMRTGSVGKWGYYSFHAATDISQVSDGMIEEMRQILRDVRPDVIQLWGTEFSHSLAMVMAAEREGLLDRLLVHIQGLVSAITPYYLFGVSEKWIDQEKESLIRDRNRFEDRGRCELQLFQRVKHVLGRTDWDRSYVQYNCGQLQYHHCGEILREEFYRENRKWQRSQCEPHRMFISQAGYPVKGLHLILPSIRRLKELYPDVRLYIGGDNALSTGDTTKYSLYNQMIHELMEQYGICDIVIFTGRLSPQEMIEQYLSAHVYVNCSTIENSSNSVGEAQLLGTPVVASYVGGTPELIQHMQTGLLYQVDAPYRFVDCIQKIFDDDELAETISDREQEVAKERYNPEAIVSELYDMYRWVSGNE